MEYAETLLASRQIHHTVQRYLFEIYSRFIHVTFVSNVTEHHFALSHYLEIIAGNWTDYDRALINN